MNNITNTSLSNSLTPFAIITVTLSLGTYTITAASMLGYIQYKKARPRKVMHGSRQKSVLEEMDSLSAREDSVNQSPARWPIAGVFRTRRRQTRSPSIALEQRQPGGE